MPPLRFLNLPRITRTHGRNRIRHRNRPLQPVHLPVKLHPLRSKYPVRQSHPSEILRWKHSLISQIVDRADRTHRQTQSLHISRHQPHVPVVYLNHLRRWLQIPRQLHRPSRQKRKPLQTVRIIYPSLPIQLRSFKILVPLQRKEGHPSPLPLPNPRHLPLHTPQNFDLLIRLPKLPRPPQPPMQRHHQAHPMPRLRQCLGQRCHHIRQPPDLRVGRQLRRYE